MPASVGALALLIALGCAPRRVQSPQPFRADAFFPPEGPAMTAARISAEDLLSITVFEEEHLCKEARVSHDGRISFPLLGEVAVAGLTPMEVEAKLTARLREYLLDPHVAVAVKEHRSRRVYILGRVAKPGAYELPHDRPLSVVEAIALGGGFTKIAARDRTRVIRKANGEMRTFVVPVSRITSGEESTDLSLEPDDVVFVPETFF